MQGEFNGLKAIILRENESAHFVHCFAHQLQLALVSVARDHSRVSDFFNLVTRIVNVVGASCKRRDLLRESHMAKVVQGLSKNQIISSKGLNQEITLQRAVDTRWGSHYGTLLRLRGMFSSVLDVLEIIEEDGIKKDQWGEALKLLKEMQCFEFVFNLHLMISLLSITNEFSQALQRKDQDIVNAMKLFKASKEQLQVMRDDGWCLLMDEINLFCGEFRIIVPDMNDIYFEEGRKRSRIQFTNYDLYKVELFVAVIDLQSQELNNRFNEVNTELLLTMACLNPVDSFAAFDIDMLVRFANLYPNDFSDIELWGIRGELKNFIYEVTSDHMFQNLKGISELSQTMVKTNRHTMYPLVYRLVTLALILPVAIATVERAFSSMKIVKNRLRNRMSNDWLNDSLVTYIEKVIFEGISNEDIMKHFQQMKPHRRPY